MTTADGVAPDAVDPAAGAAAAAADRVETRKDQWERAAEIPLALGALAFLAAYALPIVWTAADAWIVRLCTVVIQVVWLALLVDYEVRFVLARHKVRFFWHNLLDLAVLALPVIRQLRLLRLVALLSIIDRAGARTLRGRVVTYATAGTALIFVVGSLAMTKAEAGVHGATITNLGDAFWFAIATLTTVGYGDVYPVTTNGRLIAAGLMLGGLALFGTVTATLASFLTSQVSQGGPSTSSATSAQVSALAAEVGALRAQLAEHDGVAPVPHAAHERRGSGSSVSSVSSGGAHPTEARAGSLSEAIARRLPALPTLGARHIPWIERPRVRAVLALCATLLLLVLATAATAGASLLGAATTAPSQAVLAFAAGTVVMVALATPVIAFAFRGDRTGVRACVWITWGMVTVLTVVATVIVLDSASSTPLVTTLGIAWVFVGGAPLAMSFAQSRPASAPMVESVVESVAESVAESVPASSLTPDARRR